MDLTRNKDAQHQDVAGVVERLSACANFFASDYGYNRADHCNEAATLIESLSKALSEAEAERDGRADELRRLREAIRVKGGDEHSPTWDAYVLACRAIDKHRARADAAIKVIEPFASTDAETRIWSDDTDNSGQPYQSQWLADALAAARDFLNAGKE